MWAASGIGCWNVVNALHVAFSVVFQSINERMLPYSEIETQAILSLDDDIKIITDEVFIIFIHCRN